MNITIVVGARPNFMKVAPILKAFKEKNETLSYPINWELVHTGQHFDERMSQTFFRQLNIPEPTLNLNAGGGTQAEQTATIMMRFEEYLEKRQIAHVEAGIRSGDIGMPEEINRIVTDSISDYFFTTTAEAALKLKSTISDSQNIYYVGNTMIDTLEQNLPRLTQPEFWERLKLSGTPYLVMTMHRPSNVDETQHLEMLMNRILHGCGQHKIIFPIHPRTKKNLDLSKFDTSKVFFCDPLGYLEFIYLVKHAKGVITDSGGITEEASYLNIPCMTLRENTERPETTTLGTNELVGNDPDKIDFYIQKMINGDWKEGKVPKLWDGKASQRIVDIIVQLD